MTAGGVGQAIAVPCDLIKVRMQGDAKQIAAGKLDKPRYSSLLDAFVKIKAEDGIAGFYKGATPAIQRAALVNLGELTTYVAPSRRAPPPGGWQRVTAAPLRPCAAQIRLGQDLHRPVARLLPG